MKTGTVSSPSPVLTTQVAKGYYIPVASVSQRQDLIPALTTMLMNEGAHLLEVMVGKEK